MLEDVSEAFFPRGQRVAVTQEEINKMINGDLESILNGVRSDVPILVMNAILQGVRHKINHDSFLKEVKKQMGNGTELLHVRIADVAVAALDALSVERYAGNDATVLRYIEDMRKIQGA